MYKLLGETLSFYLKLSNLYLQILGAEKLYIIITDPFCV